MLGLERRKKAALRQRGYRLRRKELEAAEAAALAAGVPFERPPKGQHLIPFQFKPGHASTRKGVRQRLSRDFITAFHQHFLERGHAVFDELLANDPATYARLLTSIVAKQVEVHTDVTSEFSDDYVLRIVDGIDRWCAAHPNDPTGASLLSSVSEAEIVP